MAVKKITRGLDKIEVGAVGADGGAGTTLAVLGYSDRDSPVTLIEEDPTIDDLFAHEIDIPLDSEITAGKTELLFTVVDPDATTLASIFGGTATGTGTGATYDFPSSKSIADKTVKITPKKGLIITIPRGGMYGKINADFAKAGKFAIDMVVTVLQPTKANTAPMTFGPDVSHTGD